MTGSRLLVDVIPLPGWSHWPGLVGSSIPSIPGWYVDVVLGDPGLEIREVRSPESCRPGAVALAILSENLEDGSPLPSYVLEVLEWIIERYEERVVLISDRDHWWRPDKEGIARVFYMRAEKAWCSPRETWLPLGWSVVFDPRMDFSTPPADTLPVVAPGEHEFKRDTYISFVGSDATSGDRRALLKCFEDAMPGLDRKLTRSGSHRDCCLSTHERWARRDLLGKYRDIIRDSCFVLTPAGFSAETFRIYESLESGAIPVVVGKADSLRTYEARIRSSYPGVEDLLPLFEEWPSALEYIEGFIGDEAGLRAERDKLLAMWEDWKSAIRSNVAGQLRKTCLVG